jgi:enoyl-CoA hydratase/carnithine racemase
MEFKTLKVALADAVATIQLNLPERANAMEQAMWTELRDAMRWLDETPAARVGLLSGAARAAEG